MSPTIRAASPPLVPSRSSRHGSKAGRVRKAGELIRRSRKFRSPLLSELEPRTPLSTISDNAFPPLSVRATADQSQFYVYQNSDSGLNHGFPSGFFGDSQATLAKLHINPAAIDDP
jgi:hypothetical protein